MNYTRILLDLDGVLASFHAHALAFFNAPFTVSDMSGTTWLPDLMGITEDDFWEHVNEEPRAFWYEMPKLDDADDIVALCCKAVGDANVAICSSPSRQASSVFWKQEWVRRHYPQFARRTILTAAKYFCSGPGVLLVDDWEKNSMFGSSEYGGTFFLLPRPWNARRGTDPVAALRWELYGGE